MQLGGSLSGTPTSINQKAFKWSLIQDKVNRGCWFYITLNYLLELGWHQPLLFNLIKQDVFEVCAAFYRYLLANSQHTIGKKNSKYLEPVLFTSKGILQFLWGIKRKLSLGFHLSSLKAIEAKYIYIYIWIISFYKKTKFKLQTHKRVFLWE